jgi:hypothetical protein
MVVNSLGAGKHTDWLRTGDATITNPTNASNAGKRGIMAVSIFRGVREAHVKFASIL